MTGIRGLLVCVEYDDLLKVTLPRNLKYLDELLVITSPADTRTQALAANAPRTRLHVTDAFYRDGAHFNKGLALEEGFDVLGREGWLLVVDADIVLPPKLQWPALDPQILYGARRHMLDDMSRWSDTLDWAALPLGSNPAIIGCFQLFHADAAALTSRPWYATDWQHCGGCDSDFTERWPASRQRHLDFHVLHLGPQYRNWCGRITDRLDQQPIVTGDRETQMLQIYTQRQKRPGEIGNFERLSSKPVLPQLP